MNFTDRARVANYLVSLPPEMVHEIGLKTDSYEDYVNLHHAAGLVPRSDSDFQDSFLNVVHSKAGVDYETGFPMTRTLYKKKSGRVHRTAGPAMILSGGGRVLAMQWYVDGDAPDIGEFQWVSGQPLPDLRTTAIPPRLLQQLRSQGER